MSTFPIESRSFAEGVLLRPRLYTASGSLSEILALLEGYDIAVSINKNWSDDESPVTLLKWLRGYCEMESHHFLSPERRVQTVLDRFGGEHEALVALLAQASSQRRERDEHG